MWTDYTILLIMVFVAVALLSMAMFVPTFGTNAHIARQLRKRVREVEAPSTPRPYRSSARSTSESFRRSEKRCRAYPGWRA